MLTVDLPRLLSTRCISSSPLTRPRPALRALLPVPALRFKMLRPGKLTPFESQVPILSAAISRRINRSDSEALSLVLLRDQTSRRSNSLCDAISKLFVARLKSKLERTSGNKAQRQLSPLAVLIIYPHFNLLLRRLHHRQAGRRKHRPVSHRLHRGTVPHPRPPCRVPQSPGFQRGPISMLTRLRTAMQLEPSALGRSRIGN